LPGGECVATLRGHSYPVNALAVAPDGETIFSGSSDETVRVWALREYNLGGGAHRGGGGECVATLRGHSGAVWALEVSPDGETLFSGSGDKTVRMWSVRMGIFPRALPGGGEGDGSGVTTLSGHSRDVKALAMAPDGKTLYSVSVDKTVRMWTTRRRAKQTKQTRLMKPLFDVGITQSKALKLMSAHMNPNSLALFPVGLYKLNSVYPWLESVWFQPLNLK
jgi:WD40 repeat protein